MNDSEANQIFDLQSSTAPGERDENNGRDISDHGDGILREAAKNGGKPVSYLKLSEERRAWLVERACDRIDECRAKMGLVFGQGLARPGSWAWDRQIAQMQYDGVFDWRRDSGGVFLENNWSM